MASKTCSVCSGLCVLSSGRYDACYTCGGSGHGSHTDIRCTSCGGSGQSSQYIQDQCWNCHGTGSIEVASNNEHHSKSSNNVDTPTQKINPKESRSDKATPNNALSSPKSKNVSEKNIKAHQNKSMKSAQKAPTKKSTSQEITEISIFIAIASGLFIFF